MKGFFRGLKRPFSGAGYLLRHPALLRFGLPPALITAALLLGAITYGWGWGAQLTEWMWTRPGGDGWWVVWLLVPLWWTVTLIVRLLVIGLGAVVVQLISLPIAGPFYDALSEQVEELETGRKAPPFRLSVMLASLWITVRTVLTLLLLQLVVVTTLVVVGWIPVIGQVATAIGSFLVTPLIMGMVPLDYPMALRLWSTREKLGFMRRSFGEVFGFSVTTAVVTYVPLLNLLLLPGCVVGATQLIVSLEETPHTPADRRAEFHKKTQTDG